MPRSTIENHPQNGPNRSKINSAWPRCVAAPSRTVISWTTMAIANVSRMKRKEEPDAELCAGRGVGQHARTIVLAEHHQNSRADEQPQQA